MDIIRTVVIGFGGMGSKYAKMLAENQIRGMKLTGICCRNQAGQQAIRELYPEVSIYGDVADTFAHAEEFDAVIIVTPHTTHVEIGKLAFAHGKHVLCDKPAGISTLEVRELLAEKKPDTEFAMMFNYRTSPAFKRAKSLMEEGKLGRVTRAIWVCNDWFRSPAYHRSAAWRSSWEGECGGLLINQCQHYLDLWQWLFGMPDVVDADIDFGKYNDFTVDDSVDLRFLYSDAKPEPTEEAGTSGTFGTSEISGKYSMRGTFISASGEHPGVNRLEIWGTHGRLTITDAKTLSFDENDVDLDAFNQQNTEIYAQPKHHSRVVEGRVEASPYVVMLQNFSDHLRAGIPLIAEGEEGLKSIMLANAAYLSAWKKQRVELPFDDGVYARELDARRA